MSSRLNRVDKLDRASTLLPTALAKAKPSKCLNKIYFQQIFQMFLTLINQSN